jgi:hypothetical protein
MHQKIGSFLPAAGQNDRQDEVTKPASRRSGRRKVVGRTSKKGILRSYLFLAEQWHPEKNRISKWAATARDDVWWQCPRYKTHVWMATVYERAKRQLGCPFCFIKEKAVAEGRSLAERFPEVARQWHPTKNGKLSPSQIAAGSDRTVWWICDQSDKHIWRARIDKRTLRQQPCPFCRRSKPLKPRKAVPPRRRKGPAAN